MGPHSDLYSLFLRKIKIIIIFCILLSYGTSVFAKGPNLTGSMKKFQLTPITKNSLDETGYFNWKNAKGEVLSLSNFKGRIVLLNFWATWCLPCIKELPSMERLQTKFKEDDFTIIAISLDRGGKSVAARLLRRLKLKKLTLYTDKENKSAQKLGVKFMPTTFIFDREGRKLGKLQGGIEWDSTNAEALIKYFINHPNYASTKKE
jgi:thiol-disulfide isomerase/thioredoxin